MKKYFLSLLFVICAAPVFADSTSTTTVTTNPQANSVAVSEGSSGGSVTYAPVSTSISEKQKIPVAAPAAAIITASNDTCMGSISGSISTISIGISIGKTWTDDNCVMLKNSREFWNMGFKDAAIARMCMDTKNRDALEVTGIKCPDFDKIRADRKKAKEAVVGTTEVK